MEDGGDNYADILEELDPLPELPETADDRFFSKEALDFQYTTGPVENPLFPTWGSTGAEMAAIGAAAAAAKAKTPPPAAATAASSSSPPSPSPSPATAPTKTTTRAAAAAARGGGGGKKRALRTPSQEHKAHAVEGRYSAGRGEGSRLRVEAAAVPPSATGDRTVFLRQRLGGESVSSGNSSTSTGSGSGSGSDNGSASDDLPGEWEGGGASADAAGANADGGVQQRNRRGGARRTKNSYLQSEAAAAAAAAAAGAVAPAAVVAGSSPGASQAPVKVGLRAQYGGSCRRKGRHRKSGGGRGGGASDGSSSGSAAGGSTTASVTSGSSHSRGRSISNSSCGSTSFEGAYSSWDALVKPFKQQWDHVEAPAAVAWSAAAAVAVAAAGGEGGAGGGGVRSAACPSPRASGGVCSVFSAEPLPNSTTAFSVEQGSAQAHPMAVASYVLRVRCAGGAHIVRRTWDDIVSLCTMLGRDLAHSSSASAAGTTSSDSGSGSGSSGGAGKAAAGAAAAAVEFTPADVLAPDAASGFLKGLLARPGMASATPARRFLELEYLDGTLRGGVADHSRANAARHVASLAALTTATAVTAAARAALAVENNAATAAA
ncbi:unnamed protein product, partial [Pylaiella littoralis]